MPGLSAVKARLLTLQIGDALQLLRRTDAALAGPAVRRPGGECVFTPQPPMKSDLRQFRLVSKIG